MSVAERLKLIAEENDLSLRKLSISIGKTPGYLSASINKGTEVGSDALSQILVNYPSYNIIWVLTGEGEKLKKDVNDAKFLGETENDYRKASSISVLDSGVHSKKNQQLINIDAFVEIIKNELITELKKIETNRDDISRLAANQGGLLMKLEAVIEKVGLKKSS